MHRAQEGLAVNMRRAARTALTAPLLVAGGVLFLTLGTANVFAASSTGASASATAHSSTAANVPQSSSKPHKHERVECTPGRVAEKHGQCAVVFTDPKTKSEPSPVGQRVCFSVSPADAGSVGTGAGDCAHVGTNHKALGTFTASGNYCGKAVITATEGKEKQSHHTTITIVCTKKDATTTAAIIPAGSPLPPASGGWLLGAIGVAAAVVTGYALRTRRWFAPRRLAAGQSA
jgi:hypothetical protein